MKTSCIIINMKRIEATNQLEVILMVNKKKHCYSLEISKFGVSTQTELEKIMRQSQKRSRYFADIAWDICEGKVVEFPVDISDV